jgi:hypothetical protein
MSLFGVLPSLNLREEAAPAYDVRGAVGMEVF